VRRRNQWHAVEEIVKKRDTPALIETIQDLYQQKGHKIIMYPDASGGSRKSTNASMSDISLLKQAGFEIRAKAKNPDVKDRINAVQRALGSMKLFVNHNACPNVANCLEQQSYDKNGMPDKRSGKDHQNDATTYPIAYEMPIIRPIWSLPISFMSKSLYAS
jgi:hypothetical protein